MNSFNSCTFIGTLGKDCEMRYVPSGSAVTTFSIAVNRKYKGNDGEIKEEVEWVSIITWNKTAEICNQVLLKGSRVFVEGRLHTRSWDGQDGQKHYRTEVIANRVIFLDRKPSNGNVAAKTEEIGDSQGDITPEDLPF